jgi:hypothetical protein
MFSFAGFGTDKLRCEEAMKTAGRGNPNHWPQSSETEHLARKVRTDPAYLSGLRSKKKSSPGTCVFS